MRQLLLSTAVPLTTFVFTVTAAFLPAAPLWAQESYPSRNIRMIVPSPTGGPSDIVARSLGEKLTHALGRQVVVDNRTGAAQIIGSNLVAKADPDGYTLLQAAANMAVNPLLVKDLPYDTLKDFAAVSMTHLTPYVFLVSAQSPVKSLPELIKYARADPRKITYGTTGPGSPHQLATLLLVQIAGGLNGMTEVQYKGSTPAHPDLIANRISFMIDPLAAAAPHVRAGLLRGLAVSTRERNPSFPDMPAATEAGLPGYEFSSWGGVFAPAGTPRAVILKLNAAIGAALAMPDIDKRFTDMGLVARNSTPEAFGKFLEAEIARWRTVLAKKT